jgi:hypothetical protein
VNGRPVRFTDHALHKVRGRKGGGFDVSEDLAMKIPLHPHRTEPARAGRMFAQSPIDERHLLRVLFEEESDGLVIIAVYVGARRQYEI